MIFFKNKPRTCKAIEFIYQFASKSKRGESYKRSYRNIARHLSNFEKERGIDIMSNTYTDSVADDFVFFLKEKGLTKNTISGYTGKVAFMFRKMAKRGYEVNFSFEDIIIESEDIQSIYITSEEIERIADMNIRNKERDIARDRFVCNCLVGMRYGDFASLTADNIQGGMIVRKTKKTGQPVVVPIHRIVKKIMEKYDGNFPGYGKSLQNYNCIIKRICKQAGITDKVLTERTIGHKIIRKTYKRYELVGSHTARRSFATNAYLSGIQTAKIMLITGHATEQCFFKYIRIGKKENAKDLAEHPFFK